MSLAPEFQRKQMQQAKQFQEASSSGQPTGTKTPTEHPEDTIIIRNILVDDNTEVEEVIPYANARPSIDPSTGQQHFVNQIETKTFEHSWNTKEFFEVRWDGRPHRVKAGETRRMPRYLADHFAKHLIDFMLAQREDKEELQGLVKNRQYRRKLYDQIIVGVDSYYNGDMFDYEREGTYVEDRVKEMNQGPDDALNIGEVPNPAAGYGLTDDEPVHVPSDDELLADPEEEPQDTTSTQPKTKQEIIDRKSKKQLVAEAQKLGIELKGRENKEQIYDLISNF